MILFHRGNAYNPYNNYNMIYRPLGCITATINTILYNSKYIIMYILLYDNSLSASMANKTVEFVN